MDSNDIRSYYFVNEYRVDGHFLEGGTINLSGIRQRGNPVLIDPFTAKTAFKDNFTDDKIFDTLMAVVSANEPNVPESKDKFNTNYNRDYKSTSFLPDTVTGIFFPGWDVTYSTNESGISNPFFATIGLGSPFPEDMKLCAAANGMWPVASPDAGRTFQGSLEPFPLYGKPSTSVPLMDDEIGYHADSPYGIRYGQTFGWDGEQGPFMKRDPISNQLLVNFTDIGRADYVANILDPMIGFDMSRLRNLESRELIRRMECLKDGIEKISNRRRKNLPEFTKYWLVSAEAIADWKAGASAHGIADNLIGTNKDWVTNPDGLSGNGYLFIFALAKKNDPGEFDSQSSKRRNIGVQKIAICKIAKQDLSAQTVMRWVVLKTTGPVITQGSSLQWRQ